MTFKKSLTNKNTRKEPTILIIGSFPFSKLRYNIKIISIQHLAFPLNDAQKTEPRQLLIDGIYILAQFILFVKGVNT